MNPYLPFYEYIPDGEPRVFDGRLYIYGSHDAPGCNQFCTRDYAVWSCDIHDFTEWKYEGISYRRTDDPHNADGRHALFAPDVVKGNDGYYYLYYCLDFLQEIGVARSRYPAGPFAFYGHVRYPDGSLLREGFPYDPSVLVDDDRSVYLYYGFAPNFTGGTFGTVTPGPGCMVTELEEDMLTVKTDPVLCLPSDKCCAGTSFSPEHAYFEAPSIRKMNEIYYLVYSSQSQHELCYAVSKSPDRGFIYQGVIISNGDVGLDGNRKPVNYTGTNHGGLCQINGSLYIFYHRNTHGLASSRQGCAEKLHPDSTGRIPQAGVTSYGLAGKPYTEKREFSAFEACYLECMDTSPMMKIKRDYRRDEPYYVQDNSKENPSFYIRNIKNRCLFGYNAFQLDRNAEVGITIRGSAAGTMRISSDREGLSSFGEIKIAPEKEWKQYKVKLTNEPGVYKLYFTFLGEGKLEYLAMTIY